MGIAFCVNLLVASPGRAIAPVVLVLFNLTQVGIADNQPRLGPAIASPFIFSILAFCGKLSFCVVRLNNHLMNMIGWLIELAYCAILFG
jgi:hypothetical protein